MISASMKRWQRRLAEASARLFGRVLDPASLFKATGVMPYAEAPERPRILRQFDEAPLFGEPPPATPSLRTGWSTSRSKGPAMAHLTAVPDGIALSTGAVFDRRGRYHGTASHDHGFVDHPGREPRLFVPEPHRLLPKIERLPRDAVALTTSNQDFYFHWLFDVLPRLHLAEQAGYGAGPFYLRTELPFQRQSLRMLGVSERCLADRRGTRAISAKNLIVPCHHVMPGRVFPEWAIGFLRSRFLPQVSTAERPATRLYISRRKAGHRRVLDEPELIGLLSEYGFVPIELEELAFHDQVSLFRTAQVVVAPHGGGLANLVFCQPGATVVELFPAANIDLYYRLSTQLQINYLYVKSRSGPGDAMGSESYHIDPVDLRAAVDAAISGGFNAC